MYKNEKGVTLTILVVTLIVLMILAGVIMSINMSLNKSADLKDLVTTMKLIQTAASDYSGKYLADTEITEDDAERKTYKVSDKFVGEHQDYTNQTGVMNQIFSKANKLNVLMVEENREYWFRLYQSDLDEFGIDVQIQKDKSGNDKEIYFVNYKTLDVVYAKIDSKGDYIGIKARKTNQSKEQYYYFLEDIQNLKTDEVRN